MKKTHIEKTRFFDHDNMVNNEKAARAWAANVEKDLTRVAAWTAHHIRTEKEEEWDSLHRVAYLHNNILAASVDWAQSLGRQNLHFTCAIHNLLPIGDRFLDWAAPPASWGEERACDKCSALPLLSNPSSIVREATVAALSASKLPGGDWEENPDPKMDYLVKHMLRMLFRSKRKPDKETTL